MTTDPSGTTKAPSPFEGWTREGWTGHWVHILEEDGRRVTIAQRGVDAPPGADATGPRCITVWLRVDEGAWMPMPSNAFLATLVRARNPAFVDKMVGFHELRMKLLSRGGSYIFAGKRRLYLSVLDGRNGTVWNDRGQEIAQFEWDPSTGELSALRAVLHHVSKDGLRSHAYIPDSLEEFLQRQLRTTLGAK